MIQDLLITLGFPGVFLAPLFIASKLRNDPLGILTLGVIMIKIANGSAVDQSERVGEGEFNRRLNNV